VTVKIVAPIVFLLVLLALSVLSDPPQPRADFVFVNRGSIQTLDPQRMTYTQDLRIGYCLYEGLCRIDNFSPDWKPVPGVAERWAISDDGLTYTFHLREDAKWSNGAPVTAHDFTYSWMRALLPDTAADYAELFQLVRGGADFFRWRQEALARFAESEGSGDPAAARALWEETERTFAEMVGLRVIDDLTLEVTLEARTPYFLELCAFGGFQPVYRPLVEQYVTINPESGRLNQTHGWTKPGVHIGNGPFILSEWRFKRDMRMEANPHYWDRDALNIDSLASIEIDDPNTAVLAFQTGAVDWLSSVGVDYKADMIAAKMAFYDEHREAVDAMQADGLKPLQIDNALPDDPRKNIHAFAAFGTYFYNFMCAPTLQDGRENPFHDARVRRAFALATDKQRIVRSVTRLHEPVARTFIPPGSLPGYESPKGLGFDVGAAITLLAEAGWRRKGGDGPLENGAGEPFIVIEILYNTDGHHEDIATDIKNQWEALLGVEVELRAKEVKVYGDDLDNHNFIIGRGSWYGDYGDPTTFLDKFRTTNGNNDAAFSSERFDQLMEEARLETDRERRMSLLSDAERLAMEEELPILPLYHYVEIYLFDAGKLTGITDHPRQSHYLYRIDVLDDGQGRDEPLGSALR
jgi:oligopeptide transport system substrate-binding protein